MFVARRLWSTAGLALSLLSARAQLHPPIDLPQPRRLEIVGDHDEQRTLTLPLPADSSVVVYSEQLLRHEGDAQKHVFRAFDHAFAQRWQTFVHLPVGSECAALAADGNRPYALFVTGDEKLVTVVTFDPATGAAAVRPYHLPVQAQPLAFEAHGGAAYLVATAFRQQTVMRLSLTGRDSVAQLLPMLSAPNTSVSDLAPDATGAYVVTVERMHHYARLLGRQFDATGRTPQQLLALPGPYPVALTAARVALLADSTAPRLLAGTYATHDVRFAQGIFTTLLPPDAASLPTLPIRYYDLPTLPHFYDRFGPRHRQRARERAVRRRQEGIETVARTRLLLHRPQPLPDGGYLLVAEQYYPRYRAGDVWSLRNYSRALGVVPGLYPFTYGVPGLYGVYDPTTFWNQGFDGYVYSQALVLAFDATGQLRWQQAFVLDDVIDFTLREKVAVTVMPGGREIGLAVAEGEDVRYAIVGGRQPGPEAVPRTALLPPAPDRERVAYTKHVELLPWLRGQVLACGYQRIVVRGGKSREVFFVNVVQLATQPGAAVRN